MLTASDTSLCNYHAIMSNVSPDLEWLVIRKNSSHLVKRYGKFYTKERNNVKAIHSYAFNGHVRTHPVGIEETKEKDGIVLITRTDEPSNKPALREERLELKPSDKLSNPQIYKEIAKKLRGSDPRYTRGKKIDRSQYYRQDLCMAAIKKASALLQSQARSK